MSKNHNIQQPKCEEENQNNIEISINEMRRDELASMAMPATTEDKSAPDDVVDGKH